MARTSEAYLLVIDFHKRLYLVLKFVFAASFQGITGELHET